MPPEPRGACPAIGELEAGGANNDLEHSNVGESTPEDDMVSGTGSNTPPEVRRQVAKKTPTLQT